MRAALGPVATGVVLGSDPFWEVVAAQIRWLRKGKVRQKGTLFVSVFRPSLAKLPGNCEFCVRLTLR